MNNKVLLSVLGLLVLIFVSTNFFKKNNSRVILQTDLISIDSLKVNQIDIFNQNSDTLSIINDKVFFHFLFLFWNSLYFLTIFMIIKSKLI